MRSVDRPVELLALMMWFLVAACLVANEVKGGDDKQYVDQHYPDFGFLPPPSEYKGRVFTLSQRYPKAPPPASRLPSFLKLDFKTHWREYLLAAQEYCFADNVLGGDVANDFDAAQRDEPNWFHVPWQHFGPTGREGVHGLTQEAPVEPKQFAARQTYADGQVYAVGLYNAFGGYTIGKVWADREHPDPKDIRFPVGTVVIKILFTDVPTNQVPSLANPLLWNAYVTETFTSTKRVFKNLALVQMDLIVRDDRAPSGWVFGGFQYNGQLNRENRWKNLAPIGLQWGNDPHVNDGVGPYSSAIPTKTLRNPQLRESIINPDDAELPPTRLGWNGRLNGPCDNYMSTCMSCHMTAQTPTISPGSPLFLLPPTKIPAVGSMEWMRWFANLKCAERFDLNQPTLSTDFSLQLAVSLQNFATWQKEATSIDAEDYRRAQQQDVASQREYEVRRNKK